MPSLLWKISFQSTHPVRGGTRLNFIQNRRYLGISIHPPREGWDKATWSETIRQISFQSTHPVRGGTSKIFKTLTKKTYFNPPTP